MVASPFASFELTRERRPSRPSRDSSRAHSVWHILPHETPFQSIPVRWVAGAARRGLRRLGRAVQRAFLATGTRSFPVPYLDDRSSQRLAQSVALSNTLDSSSPFARPVDPFSEFNGSFHGLIVRAKLEHAPNSSRVSRSSQIPRVRLGRWRSVLKRATATVRRWSSLKIPRQNSLCEESDSLQGSGCIGLLHLRARSSNAPGAEYPPVPLLVQSRRHPFRLREREREKTPLKSRAREREREREIERVRECRRYERAGLASGNRTSPFAASFRCV